MNTKYALFVSLFAFGGLSIVEPQLQFREWRCFMTSWRMGFEGFCVDPDLCERTSKWVKIGDHRLCPGLWPPKSCCYYSRYRRNRGPKPNKKDLMPESSRSLTCSPYSGNLDIFIVLDISHRSTAIQFGKAKRAIVRFIDAVPLGQSRIRIGLVTYSNYAKLLSPLNKDTAARMISILHRLSRSGKHSRPSKALAMIRRFGFRRQYGDRRGVKNVIVAFCARPVHSARFYRLIRLFKRKRTIMFSVYMNRGTNKDISVTFPSSPAHSFALSQHGFNGDRLAAAVCRSVPAILGGSAACPDLDVIIVFDNSAGTTSVILERAKALALDMINRFRAGTRVGILYDVTRLQPTLKNGNTKAGLKKIIDSIKTHQAPPRAEKSLVVLFRKGFRLSNGDRPNARNRVVFLTNGRMRNRPTAMLMAQRLRFMKKVDMYVVSLGGRKSRNYILQLVPPKRRFDILHRDTKGANLADELCN